MRSTLEPNTAMTIVLLALAPAAAIALAVILRDRYEPEPRGRLIVAFMAGAASILVLAGFRILVGTGDALLASSEAATRLLAWILFVSLSDFGCNDTDSLIYADMQLFPTLTPFFAMLAGVPFSLPADIEPRAVHDE